MNACVFLGPTLTADDATSILDVTVLPPVRLGDVYRAVSRLRPRAIGIVDGYFQWAPAVWHKEILWAIGQGVHVFGAASMGALRAAELAPFGMRGVGSIFEAYRDGRFEDGRFEDGPFEDGPFEDDDEVAVVHGPPESGYRGASDAMVDIRCTLARAAVEGVVSETTRQVLVAAAKALFFPDRRFPLLLEHARAAGLPEPELARLEHWLPTGRVDQKRRDAVAMLEAVRDLLAADPPPAQADFTVRRTVYWERAQAAFRAADAAPVALLTALRLDAADCERLDPDELRHWYFAHVAERPVPDDLGAWMRQAGYTDPGEFHRDAFAQYLRRSLHPDGPS